MLQECFCQSAPLRVSVCPRPSLERLCQASLTLTDGRAAGPEAPLSMELLSSHQALVQEAWTRLRGLQEYQAFMEALRAMGNWLEEVEKKLEKLESTEGNKREVEERLEQVQVHRLHSYLWYICLEDTDAQLFLQFHILFKRLGMPNGSFYCFSQTDF